MSDQTRNLPKLLRDTAEAIRPHVETLLDLRDIFADYRKAVTEAGGDWMALKNLVKAQAEDARDENGAGERVEKLLQRADLAASYADILGIGAKLNENYSFKDGGGLTVTVPATPELLAEKAYWDERMEREIRTQYWPPATGEVTEDRSLPAWYIPGDRGDDPQPKGGITEGSDTISSYVSDRVYDGVRPISPELQQRVLTKAVAADDWQCPPIPDYLRRA